MRSRPYYHALVARSGQNTAVMYTIERSNVAASLCIFSSGLWNAVKLRCCVTFYSL